MKQYQNVVVYLIIAHIMVTHPRLLELDFHFLSIILEFRVKPSYSTNLL